MTNKLFRDRLNTSIETCLREAENVSALGHPGMIGELRQTFIEKLLFPVLPPTINIGTGKITDKHGNLSAQTDVVIYNPNILPSLMYDEKTGIFPIESVYYAIEDKSKLSSTEIEKSIENGTILRTLDGRQPCSCLFAFSSDQTSEQESKRFIQREKNFLIPLPVDVVCVVVREYFFWKDVRWNLLSIIEDHNEIAGFIVGIANTIYSVMYSTVGETPGYYLF